MKNFVLLMMMFCSICIASQYTEALEGLEYQEKKWVVKDIGTISSFSGAYPIDFSDNGQVLFCTNTSNKNVYGLGNAESEIVLLPELPIRQGHADTQVYWRRIDSSGLVIGIKSMTTKGPNGGLNGFYPVLVTWSPLQGIKQYNFDPSINLPHEFSTEIMKIGQCENSKEIVLTCEGRVMILMNEKILDITSKLDGKLIDSGVSFYKLEWNAIAVNDNGVIFGIVDIYDKHPFKDVPIYSSSKLFLWRSNYLLTHDVNKSSSSGIKCYLSNNNKASFNIFGLGCFVWDMFSNSVENIEFASSTSKKIIAILDDDTIVFDFGNGNIFYRETKDSDSIYLKLTDINSGGLIENKFLSIQSPSLNDMYFPVVNNCKNICFRGVFINENHPFILVSE